MFKVKIIRWISLNCTGTGMLNVQFAHLVGGLENK